MLRSFSEQYTPVLSCLIYIWQAVRFEMDAPSESATLRGKCISFFRGNDILNKLLPTHILRITKIIPWM